MSSSIIFLLNNTLKQHIKTQYIFNVFIACKTVSYLKSNFKQNLDLKIHTIKNLEDISKHFEKTSGKCVYIIVFCVDLNKILFKL